MLQALLPWNNCSWKALKEKRYMEGQNVAIYLDFENLAISADSVYPSRNKPLELEPILDFATTKGAICLKKAYADWSKDIFGQYQRSLMNQGFDLVHLPETNLQGKNGSDVRLAVDVMEYVELFQHVDVIIIGSGDTDFIPLIQRLRSKGKTVVVIGFEHSVGGLVKRNSTEFKSLEELIGEPEVESISHDLREKPEADYGRNLMLRFLRSRDDEEPVLMSRLKQQLLRLDPSFSEKELGFSSFKQFVISLQGDIVDRVDTDKQTLPIVYLSEPSPQTNGHAHIPPNGKESASQFLSRKLRYHKDAPKRLEMAYSLFHSLNKMSPLSMNQMFEQVYAKLDGDLPKSDIKKYINTLFTGGAFQSSEKKAQGPLLNRPFLLAEGIVSYEGLDQIYIQRVSEILQSRYSHLASHEILEILI